MEIHEQLMLKDQLIDRLKREHEKERIAQQLQFEKQLHSLNKQIDKIKSMHLKQIKILAQEKEKSVEALRVEFQQFRLEEAPQIQQHTRSLSQPIDVEQLQISPRMVTESRLDQLSTKFENELRTRDQALSELNEQYRNSVYKNIALQQQVETLNDQLLQTQKGFQEQEEKLRERINESSMKVKQLEVEKMQSELNEARARQKQYELQEQLGQKDSQLSSFEFELSSCRNQLEVQRMEIQNTVNQIQTLEETNACIRKELIEKIGQVSTLECEKDLQQKVMDQIKSQKESSSNKVSPRTLVKNETEALQFQISILETQLEEKENIILRLENQISSQKKNKESLTAEIEYLNESIQSKVKIILNLQTTVDQLKVNYQAQNQSLNTLKLQYEAQIKKLQDDHLDQLKVMGQIHDHEISIQMNQSEQLFQRKSMEKSATSPRQITESELAPYEETKVDIDDPLPSPTTITPIKLEGDSSSKSPTKLKSPLKPKIQQASKYSQTSSLDDVKSLQQKIIDFKEKILDLEQKLMDYQFSQSEFNNQIKLSKSDLQSSQIEIRRIRDLNLQIQQNLESTQKVKDNLELESTRLKHQITLLQNQQQQNSLNLEKYQIAETQLKSQLIDKQMEIDQLKQDLQSMTNQKLIDDEEKQARFLESDEHWEQTNKLKAIITMREDQIMDLTQQICQYQFNQQQIERKCQGVEKEVQIYQQKNDELYLKNKQQLEEIKDFKQLKQNLECNNSLLQEELNLINQIADKKVIDYRNLKEKYEQLKITAMKQKDHISKLNDQIQKKDLILLEQEKDFRQKTLEIQSEVTQKISLQKQRIQEFRERQHSRTDTSMSISSDHTPYVPAFKLDQKCLVSRRRQIVKILLMSFGARSMFQFVSLKTFFQKLFEPKKKTIETDYTFL